MFTHCVNCSYRLHQRRAVSTCAVGDGSGRGQPRLSEDARADDRPGRSSGIGGRGRWGVPGRGSGLGGRWGGPRCRGEGGDHGQGQSQGRGRTWTRGRNSTAFGSSAGVRVRGDDGGGGTPQMGCRDRRQHPVSEEGEGYSDEEFDSDDEYDNDDGGIDEGFVVIGRADPASISAVKSKAGAEASAAAAPAVMTAARQGPPSALTSDPLDGSRFWIEASGIDDLDEEDDEEGDEESEEAEVADDADEGEGPQTPEELLQNMRALGFTLQDADPQAVGATAETDSANPVASPDVPHCATQPLAPAPATVPSSSRTTSRTAADAGADLALRDLRDTFIASMKPPSLPPWFLGPVEVAASPPLRRSAAAPNGAAGRGTCLRTTRAVIPGELLAVSLPLAICFCRRGTTPENEDLADLMMGSGEPNGATGLASTAAAAPTAAAWRPAGGSQAGLRQRGDAADGARAVSGRQALAVAVANSFPGLTDLQQSLLATLRHVQPSKKVSGLGSGSGFSDDTDASNTTTAIAAVVGAGATVGGGAGRSGAVKREFLEMVARSAADSGAPRAAPLLSRAELYRFVNMHCLGEDFQDLSLCQLRGEPSLGHIALWPEAAFTAHSCAPNATAYAVGDRLVVRAVSQIPKGGEVSLNWLGALLTAPLELRRQELRQQYGFTCGCVRCTAEARYVDTPLASTLASTYAACQEMAPRLEAAISEGDVATVAAARERLLVLQAEVEAAVRAASPKVNAKVRRWLQACVYDLYDLISLCADELAAAAALGTLKAALGDMAGKGLATRTGSPVVDTESLAQCCRVVEGVAPGSDGHVYLAAELVMRSLERFGPQHEEYRQARASLVRAYGARYGNVGPGAMEQLVAARLAAEARADADAGEGQAEEQGAPKGAERDGGRFARWAPRVEGGKS